MPATKSSLSVWSGQTTTNAGSAQDISTAYEATLYVFIVQTGAATTAASFQVQVSCDNGTTYFTVGTWSAGTASATHNFAPIAIPDDATHVKVPYTQQSGGTSSAITAQLGRVTGV